MQGIRVSASLCPSADSSSGSRESSHLPYLLLLRELPQLLLAVLATYLLTCYKRFALIIM